jgi:ADP-ribose pyrophosphatase YjhB (NUDIX family)
LTGNYPATSDRFVRVSVYAILVRDGSILLCRLSDQLKDDQGKWTLPGGGIEFGEPILNALSREILEETGLSIEFESWLEVSDNCFHHSDCDVHVIRLIALANIVGGELCSELDGSTDLAQWHPLDSVDELPLVATARIGIRTYLKRKDSRE